MPLCHPLEGEVIFANVDRMTLVKKLIILSKISLCDILRLRGVITLVHCLRLCLAIVWGILGVIWFRVWVSVPLRCLLLIFWLLLQEVEMVDHNPVDPVGYRMTGFVAGHPTQLKTLSW